MRLFVTRTDSIANQPAIYLIDYFVNLLNFLQLIHKLKTVACNGDGDRLVRGGFRHVRHARSNRGPTKRGPQKSTGFFFHFLQHGNKPKILK